MDTRSTNDILVSNQILDEIVVAYTDKQINQAISKFDGLIEEFNKITEADWIQIRNKEIYYVKGSKFVIADSTRRTCTREGNVYNFAGYSGRLMNVTEAKKLFYTQKKKNPLIKEDKIVNVNDNYLGSQYSLMACTVNGNVGYLDIRDGDSSSSLGWTTAHKDTIKILVRDIQEADSLFETFVRYGWIPNELSNENSILLNKVKELYNQNYIVITEDKIIPTPILTSLVRSGEYTELNGISFERKEIVEALTKEQITLTDEIKAKLLKGYLECDTVRAQIEPYDIKRLEDPNLGHWDLWNIEDTTKTKIQTDTAFVCRNPLADVREDGIVGIDFGTKSTVVVYQDGDDYTQLMRIGCGDFAKKLDKKDYENPTVMEFRNIEDFMKDYNARAGRPYTKWEDLTISHTAAGSLANAKKSDDYYAHFNDLKQWTNDKLRQIRIRDKVGNEKVLSTFVDIKEGDFNPIELYAYYLGLFINNMYKGIYLNYTLSFPVTYENAVREKIIDSFYKGLKKSLPLEVINDEACMDQFRVLQGASEPAAYAICALQEYGFEPEEKEDVYYGIFDFGGGTTDFDFGIWHGAGPRDRRYDYIINHFGAGGDQYLGGENLLELLAFEVFKDNQDKLLENKIAFYKPVECKAFPGNEALISESQEARLNTKQLMEELRPLWEQHEGYEKLYENAFVKVQLFDKSGEMKPGFRLDIEVEKLLGILKDRIEKGVKNFFEALKVAFDGEIAEGMKEINIFLAGNSSKAKVVTELFNAYIEDYTGDICEKFVMYPPLGTPEALEIQRERELPVSEDDFTKPTGKTGVAYGLIECRPGSRIKVVSEKKSNEEVKFNFYIGYNGKKKFQVILDRDISYGKWVSFIDAGEEDFEIYYTNLPEAHTNQLPIKEVSKKLCRITEVNPDADVYIRAVAPSAIEYAVATEESIADGKVLSEIVRLELSK